MLALPHSVPPTLQQATTNPQLHWKLLDTHRSLCLSLLASLLLFPGSWCVQGSVCALQESVSSVLFEYWQLYGGVNGNLLQEGLCHTQVCCTQPYPRDMLPTPGKDHSLQYSSLENSMGCIVHGVAKSGT